MYFLSNNILFGKDELVTKWFLSNLLGIKVHTIEYKKIKRPKEYIKDYNQELDVVLVINETVLLDIEANSYYYEGLFMRNLGYSMNLYRHYLANKDSAIKEVILIDITCGLPKKKYSEIKNTSLLQTKNYEVYTNNFKSLIVDVDKVLKLWYTKDVECISKYFYILMLVMNADSLEELSNLSTISEEDKKYIKKVRKDVIEMNMDEDFHMWNERHEIYLADIQRQIRNGELKGIEEGKKAGIIEGKQAGIVENKLENARIMLKDNMSPEKISRYVGLSLAKVLELQSELTIS